MQRYRTVSEYWKKKFKERVYRISIDAGFTCPNRDGTKGFGGCIFCDEAGARPHYVEPELSVREQVKQGIVRLKGRGIEKFIAYFQAYTNTYAPVEILKQKYNEALSFPEVVGISISTRPDCIDEDIIDLLSEISKHHYTIVEVGVQSIHQKSLDFLKRMHTVEESEKNIKQFKAKKGIEVVAHLIIGIPGETDDDIIETMEKISSWGVDGVKLHHLYVVKGTILEKMYRKDQIKVYETPEEYAKIAIKSILHLSPEVVIHRLAGYATKDILIAPEWTSNRFIAKQIIDRIMDRYDLYQGGLYGGSRGTTKIKKHHK